MAGKTIDQTLKKKIVRYLKDHSQCATAKHFKVSPSTVNGIANSPEVKKTILECSEPKNATRAHKTYAKKDRLLVLNKLMERVDTAIDTPELKTGQLVQLTTAVGTLLDKYRLEEKDTDDTSKGEINDLFNRMKEADVAQST
jgi:hypothetical protein